jgi:hypothetical protein
VIFLSTFNSTYQAVNYFIFKGDRLLVHLENSSRGTTVGFIILLGLFVHFPFLLKRRVKEQNWLYIPSPELWIVSI